MLSFDEWNLWQESRFAGHTNLSWEEAPRLIEDTYTVQDAVTFGSLLMSLLRHADRVTIACLAQLVNVIGPIGAEPDRPAWARTIFHPFALTARHARGDVLRVETSTDRYDTAEPGDVPLVDVVATHDGETGQVTVFAMNRHTSEPARIDIDLRAFGDLTVAEHLYLGGDELHGLSTDQGADDPRVGVRSADRADNSRAAVCRTSGLLGCLQPSSIGGLECLRAVRLGTVLSSPMMSRHVFGRIHAICSPCPVPTRRGCRMTSPMCRTMSCRNRSPGVRTSRWIPVRCLRQGMCGWPRSLPERWLWSPGRASSPSPWRGRPPAPRPRPT
jgi:hypothetical protein